MHSTANVSVVLVDVAADSAVVDVAGETVEAVETFVEEHFQEQIVFLKSQNQCPHLVQLLEHCCEDEVHHKEDAARRLLHGSDCGFDAWWVKPWAVVVKGGSAFAAQIARRV